MTQFKKLLYLITSPVQFFEKNNDDLDALFQFARFIVRLHIAIGLLGFAIFILVNTFITSQMEAFTFHIESPINAILILIGILLFAFFIQATAAAIIIEEFGRPVHWLVKLVSGKDDLLKAKRIAVYNTAFTALLLHEYLILLLTKSFVILGIVFGVIILLSFIWQTIGIAKQYQLSWKRAFFISFLPIIVFLGIFGLIFVYVGLSLG